MTATRLDGIRACVFDAYGTLFDYWRRRRGGKPDHEIKSLAEYPAIVGA